MESNQHRRILRKMAAVLVITTGIAAAFTTQSLAQRSYGDIRSEAVLETEHLKEGMIKVQNGLAGVNPQSGEDTSSKASLGKAVSTAPAVSQYSNMILANVNESLNIRNNPSPEAQIVGKMYQGTGGDIIEKSEGWTKVKSGSVEGWVSNEYLIFGDQIEASAKDKGLYRAVITTETLRVRTEAQTEAPVAGLAALGEDYRILEELDGWLKIQYTEEDAGYISSEFAEVKIQLGKAVTIEEEQAALRASAEKEAAQRVKNSVADSDVQLMAACVMMEAGGYSYDGQLAVANVILNRLKSGRWGNSISSVIYAKGQFPGAANGKLSKHLAAGPSQTALRAVNDALNGVNNIGDYMFFNSAGRANYSSYSQYQVIDGNCFYKK